MNQIVSGALAGGALLTIAVVYVVQGQVPDALVSLGSVMVGGYYGMTIPGKPAAAKE